MLFKTLRILAVLSALANLVAEALRNQGAIYATKPLTTALIVGIAIVATPPLDQAYKVLVAAGLTLSLAGDVFLMLPEDQFVPGLTSFLLAHVCFAVAFFRARNGGLAPAYAAPFAVFGLVMLTFLWPALAMLKPAVALYVLVIQVMAWQAWATWGETRRGGALLAALGSCVFLLSDSILAIERFHRHVVGARVSVMLTYYAAQLLIASSVRR